MRAALILIAGPAGAGKSHVAHAIARVLPSTVLLDKDTLTRALVEPLLVQMGQPASDRESAVYVEQVRPLEYAALLAIAFETMQTGRIALAVAPFARELDDPEWVAAIGARTKQAAAGFGVIWVHADAQITHARIQARGEARDARKLRHWPEYVARTQFAPPTVSPLHAFHNTVTGNPARFERELASAVAFIERHAVDEEC